MMTEICLFNKVHYVEIPMAKKNTKYTIQAECVLLGDFHTWDKQDFSVLDRDPVVYIMLIS